MNQTVSAQRVHIGFFGMRNAGKSSLVNAVTGQELCVVSDVMGTTTDPVKKAMELLPLGPVVIIDTPGMDDAGDLGALRVKKAQEALSGVDIAVLVVDGRAGLRAEDEALLEQLRARGTAHVIAANKADAPGYTSLEGALRVSAKTGEGVDALKARLAALGRERQQAQEKPIVCDLLSPGDSALLVMPIDAAAPKGRLILPQQQTLRELLDNHCMALCCQDTEVKAMLDAMRVKPKLVITDSQAFGRVAKDVPQDIALTSFSILFARYKGDLLGQVRGAAALSRLRDGDKVLISEGCTHHRQCGDIGSVKIPAWIRSFTGVQPEFVFTSGTEFADDLSQYALVVHCGGCMLTPQQMQGRLAAAKAAGVPVVNYGVAIAHMHGVLRRSVSMFPQALKILEE